MVEHSSNEIHGIAKRLSWDRLGLDRLTWRERMSEKFTVSVYLSLSQSKSVEVANVYPGR